MRNVLTSVAIAILTGCTGSSDPYPELLPTERILAEPVLPDAKAMPTTVETETRARADALRRRADALRGPVIEPGTLARIQSQE